MLSIIYSIPLQSSAIIIKRKTERQMIQSYLYIVIKNITDTIYKNSHSTEYGRIVLSLQIRFKSLFYSKKWP